MKKRTPKIEETPEQTYSRLVSSGITEIEDMINRGIVPLNPTRHFKVGDRVHFGNHAEVYVREVYKDGLYYVVESLGVQRERDKPVHNEKHVKMWIEILPYGSSKNTNFSIKDEDDVFIRQINSTIHSLLYMVYSWSTGVDFDVEYQRDLVWSHDDKISLIDSIMNNYDIGKFVFIERPYAPGQKHYEIIDGKQRLTTLCEFYEDRFQYKGFYFSELSFRDRAKFLEHSIVYGTLEEPSKKKVYQTFIKMNTAGKPIDPKHIEKVKKLLEDLK